MTWQILSEENLISVDPWFTLTKQKILLPSGLEVNNYYQIYQPSYCEIAVRDESSKFLICKSYKHGVRDITFGFPGGYLNTNESPVVAAARELQEECGLGADTWRDLGSYVIDGNRGPAKVHLFLAEKIGNAPAIPSDDLEDTESFWADCNQIRDFIKLGKFKTVGACLLAEKISNI